MSSQHPAAPGEPAAPEPVAPDGLFRKLPFAHRGLHDAAAGRPENTRAAVSAAVAAGYGIEIDVQISADGVPVVFHDYTLARLTKLKGPLRDRSSVELAQVAVGGTDETIPMLRDVLWLVAGRVPLLIEVKDQDGAMGPGVGALEAAVAGALEDYHGAVAMMSFNPHAVAVFGQMAPGVPRGIVSSAYDAEHWPLLPAALRDRLRDIPDYDRVGASFISHEARDLARPRVAELKAQGALVCCWTIRSAAAERDARRIADTVTFEGYDAALPAGAGGGAAR